MSSKKDSQLKLIQFDTKKRVGKPACKEKYVVNTEEVLQQIGVDSKEESLVASLSAKELAFVSLMLENGCKAVAAYKQAFDIEGELSSAQRGNMQKVLNKEETKKALRLGIRKKMSSTVDNLDMQLLDTYIARAFYDPSDFTNDDGSPIPLSEIKESLRVVIDGVETKYYGKDASVCTVTYKLANRDTALKVLSEYMQMLRPDTKKEVIVTDVHTELSEEDSMQHLCEMSEEELIQELAQCQQEACQ